jgi:hypothetical protein
MNGVVRNGTADAGRQRKNCNQKCAKKTNHTAVCEEPAAHESA